MDAVLQKESEEGHCVRKLIACPSPSFSLMQKEDASSYRSAGSLDHEDKLAVTLNTSVDTRTHHPRDSRR